ncbi:hypothetical protein FRACA_1210014 [Frankia canadensis]|uniref:Uncharacterized protein n=1 Tax=Frankia canadensis TaxID=1836972 RepID=A0A2I2KK24_9ACTN|nr:hypothetical protein FRACA_1210014 [Frankia canadensis]SOU53311.1 hypothetical protein FRACA_1210014 [Frankia canadensis]
MGGRRMLLMGRAMGSRDVGAVCFVRDAIERSGQLRGAGPRLTSCDRAHDSRGGVAARACAERRRP